MELEFHEIAFKYRHLRVRSSGSEQRLMGALAAEGQRQPVLVVRAAAEDGYVLIDGYRRTDALRKLGRDTVDATVLEQSEADALVWTWMLSRARRRTAFEEGWLLRELAEHHALSLAVLAERFDRSRSWVSRRLGLVRCVPDTVEEAVRAGAISAHGAMKYLVPLGRAHAEHCRRIVAALGGERVSVRQLGRLYAAWRAADAELRERIVERPGLYLRAADELARDDVPEAVEVWSRVVVRDLRMIASIAARVRRALTARPRDGMSPAGQELLRDAWHRALDSVAGIEALLAPEG